MIPFGVTYYPDQWPKDSWDKTFAAIKQAGLNTVRFGEMAWDWMEPSEGKFNFSDLDYAMDQCLKHGLKVLLGIPTSQVPPWFHTKYKNSRPVAQDGSLYPEFGPRPNICKDNPNYRRLAERLTKKLVNRYKNHPALFMWQVDNEPVYPPLDHTTSNDFCHCEHSRQTFVAWAKKKYGSLKKINQVWGTSFWTNHLSSFNDIRTPKAGVWEAVSPHIFLDWFRFKTDSLKNWVSFLVKTVKKIDPKHKVGTNGFIGIATRVPDHSAMTADVDWYGLDIYPRGGRMTGRDYAFMLDLWRSFCRAGNAEFHITELQGGQNVRWGNPAYVKGPEIYDWTIAAFKHGAKSLLYHNWRPPLFGAETGGFGILQQDGSSTKRLEAIKKAGGEIRRLESPLDRARDERNSDIAIAYLHNSEVQSYQEQGPPRAISGQWEPVRTDIGLMHTLNSMAGAYQAVYKKGKPIDFIFEMDLDSGKLPYKVILLPNPYLLSCQQYNNLKKWVKNGGRLITEARFGLKDENGHLYEKPLMEDLLGIKYEYTEPTRKGFLDGIKGKRKRPQIITKKIGKGSVVYANFSLFLEIQQGSRRLKKLVRKQAQG
ncbi:MAG: beta-galactosidase [Candidatus Saganbacteria bacterium]|nr:beta-galactosidase [Candidatus Saganbacteria bacterium]